MNHRIKPGAASKSSFLVAMAFSLWSVQNSPAATEHWIGNPGVSANTNWTSSANWSAPQQTFFNQVQFLGAGAVGGPGVINNVLDATTGVAQMPIWELDYQVTNANYTTLIAPTVTLSTGAGNGKLYIGADIKNGGSQPAPANAVETITFTGAQGAITISSGSGSGSQFFVDQGSTTPGDTHNIIVDMSGLGNFTMQNFTGSRFLVAGAHEPRSHGTVYMAMTNNISLGNDFQVGYIGNYSNSLPVGVYLGQTNTILVGSGSPQVVVGYQGCMSGGFMKFNPAFLASSPAAYFGSTQAGGRMNNFWVGINASGQAPSSGSVDFSGGNVTVMTANLELGRSGSAANGASASGTLTFDTGIIDANVVLVGNQTVSGGAPGAGVINVNGTATLKVNTSMTLGGVTGTATAGSGGTLNVNGGTLLANVVTNGAGVGTMNLTNATWLLTITPGITAYGSATVTNFVTGGTTNLITLSFASLPSSYPFTNRLVVYQTLGGAGLGNLGFSFPSGGGYQGYLYNNTAANAIDLVVTNGASPSNIAWSGADLSGNWDVASTVNWTNGAGAPTTYHQLDAVRFDDTASGTTSVILNAPTLTPSGLVITNNTKNYSFAGSGSLAGAGVTGGTIPGGLVKRGTGTLVLANTTPDTYLGGVTISGGVLQVGDGVTPGSGSLSVSSGTVANSGGLVINRPSGDTFAVANLITGAGGITNAGAGTLQLNSANTFTGPLAVNAGTVQLGNNGALGTTAGGTVISSGAVLDLNGFNPGGEPVTVQGTGSGSGAIINNNNAGTPQLTAVTLSGDVTFGGSQRWDLQTSLTANNHNVTLANSAYGEWRDLSAPALGNVDITSGTLGWVGSTTGGSSGTLTVESGAIIKFYNDGALSANVTKPVVLLDGSTVANGGGANTISAPISLSGFNTFDIAGTSLTLSGALSGTGTLYKQTDTSPLFITGASPAFSGTVLVYAGKVNLNGSLGSGTSSTITMQSGTLLAGIGGVNNGPVDISGGYTPGDAGVAGTNTFASLTLEAGALMTNNLASTVASGNSRVVVNGNLTMNNSTLYINPIGGTLQNGVYTLLTYSGTFSGSLPVAQTITPSVYTLTVSNATSLSPKQIQLIASGASELLVWDNASGNAEWDVQTSGNWSNTVSHLASDVFVSPDAVAFNDSITNSAFPATSIDIGSGVVVSPSVLTNNSSVNYTFSGLGSIGGGASIVKQGSSTLTISNDNSFTGPVTISGGALFAASATALGTTTGTVTVTNGATLDVGFSLGAKPIVVAGAGVGGNGALVNNNGGAVYGGGGFNGLANTVTLLGDTTFGGTNRWDLGNSTAANLTTANHNYNLTLTGPPGSYREWAATLSIDANLGNIAITGGLEQGMKCSALGNPTNTVTIFTNSTLTFWAGSNYTKNYLVKNGGIMNVRLDGPNFNLTNTLEGGATFHSINNAKTMTAPVTLLGLANFLCDNNVCTFSNVISGVGGFNFSSGSSQFAFAAANAYTGPTYIGSGLTLALLGNGSVLNSSLLHFSGSDTNGLRLDVSGKADQKLTLASGQTLEGSGRVNGALTVSAGATVAPGTNSASPTLGAISASGAVTLNGTTTVKVYNPGQNDVIQSGSSLNYGGTLSVLFLPGTLAAGNSWKLFNAPVGTYSGSFTVTPSSPGAGLAWDTSHLITDGTLRVISTSPPDFTGINVGGGQVTISGTNGPANGNYVVLTSTNVTQNVSLWLPLSTNQFDNSGNFTWSTNFNVGEPSRYYRLKLQ